jgi:hypothetical protein
MKTIAAISVLLLSQGALAQTFKCTDAAGKILYSGRPCNELGMKDAGEVRDRLQVTPAPPPSARPTGAASRPPADNAAKPAAAAEPEQKPERRCFTTTVKGKSVTRCNDQPGEPAQ